MREKDAHWQDSADIVIAGYGGAGAVAAITAHDLGADVVLVEKQPGDAHYTNTQLSGGIFLSPSEVEEAVEYMEALYQVDGDLSWTDRDTLRAWAEYTHQNREWVEKLGGKLKPWGHRGGPYRQIPGWECLEVWRIAGSGLGLHRFLTSNVAQRGIRILFDAPAQRLIANDDGEVVGVRVLEGEARVPKDIRVRRAVILTTGGFSFDETMKLNYLKIYPAYFAGTPANTGDGIRMAQDLGADLWHMNCAAGRVVAKFPEFPFAFYVDFGGGDSMLRQTSAEAREKRARPVGYILVDRDGRRFTSENIKSHSLIYELGVYDSHRLIFPRVPCFWIFDQRRMDAGPLVSVAGGPCGPVQLYRWSRDNLAELDKGWIVKGESIAELAGKLELPADTLTETAERYSTYCHQGLDPDFHRLSEDLEPVTGPPYYGMRLFPGGASTLGGPRRNHRAQVLKVDGNPIPRLYAAGELGSTYGMLYPSGGGNLADCIAFGRIAAENAVRETPWP